MEIWLVTAILIVTLVLLITDKAPVDLVAVGLMVSLAVTGILQPNEAVAGFASPAVITVGAMFLMSRGMIRTGAVGFIGQQVIAMARGNHRLALLMSLLIVAAASAFINNTPVVVLFIPIMLAHQLRIRDQSLQVFDSRFVCLHSGGNLHPGGDLHQHYRQRSQCPGRVCPHRDVRAGLGRVARGGDRHRLFDPHGRTLHAQPCGCHLPCRQW